MIEKRDTFHYYMYFSGISILMIALPFSTWLISFAQFFLIGNFLLEFDYKNKIQKLISDKIALIIISFFILHVIGLLWTTDYNYALKDLRTKLPLLGLTIIIANRKNILKKIHFHLLLILFVASVFTASLYSIFVLVTKSITDIRDISIFISHIRFSLMVCFSIFVIVYLLKSTNIFNKFKYVLIAVLLWLIIFLFILQSITGILIFIIVSLFVLTKEILAFKNIKIRIIVLLSLLTLIISSISYFYVSYKHYNTKTFIDLKKLDIFTPKGNLYYNDTINKEYENGNLINIYICGDELRATWNKKSKFNYDGYDLKDQYLETTLIRYMTSKGLRKDELGINALNDNDIKAIENGITNYKYVKNYNIKYKIYEIYSEFDRINKNTNINGSSLLQRIEYWKTSISIINKNLFWGVGTGDMNIAFEKEYNVLKTKLEKKYRLRSHNQFLSITVGFGILGLIWFLVVLFYPMIKLKKYNSFLYLTFFLIIFLSMLNEDTIESQVGVTLFAFFNSFLLYNNDEC